MLNSTETLIYQNIFTVLKELGIVENSEGQENNQEEITDTTNSKRDYKSIISTEIKIIEKKLDKRNKKYEFITDFLKNNSYMDIASIIDIDLFSLALLFLFKFRNDISFDKIIELSINNIYFINHAVSEQFASISDIAYNAMMSEKSNCFSISEYGTDLRSLKSMYSILSEEDFTELITTITVIKLLKSIKREQIREYDKSSIIKKKQQAKMLNVDINTNYNIDYLYEKLKNCFNYANEYIHEEDKKNRELRKEFKNLIEAENWLDVNLKRKGITEEIPLCILKITNEDLKLKILEMIYKHNNRYRHVIEKEYDIYNNDTRKKIEALLKEYGIDINEYNIRIKCNYEETKYILDVLTKFDILSSNTIINIFEVTDIETIKTINNYITKGYFSKKLLHNNNELFNKNSIEFKNLCKNIELLNSINIGIDNYKAASDILLFDNEIIKHNIDILEQYKLVDVLHSTSNYNFLSIDNITDKIDTIIENKKEDILSNSLDILNYNIDTYKLFKILTNLGIEVSSENIYELFNTNNYIIDYNLLDEYIFNSIDYMKIDDCDVIRKNELISQLNRKLVSLNAYNLNGVIISKNKVLRELEKIDNDLTIQEVINIISKNMILTEEEFTNLYKAITNKEYSNSYKKLEKI